jgi:DnaK suppressor protein
MPRTIPRPARWSRAAARARLAPIRAELDLMRRLRAEQVAALGAADPEASDAGPDRRGATSLRTAAESALADIDAALERIEVGSYGTCAECREQIPDARLHALPEIPYCAACRSAVAAPRLTSTRPTRPMPA